jgi:hypothetical protein|tara:strand:+ start:317 stop:472 length:156 start_codon:yes stop_codon:yes gene_type:complete
MRGRQPIHGIQNTFVVVHHQDLEQLWLGESFQFHLALILAVQFVCQPQHVG